MILGAGRGSRLAGVTRHVPKILAPLGDRPLLQYQLAYLRSHGVSLVAVNTHHHADQVANFLNDVEPPMQVRLFHEEELLGTAGALRPARGFLNEPFLLLYGDVVTDIDLRKLYEAHASTEALATIAVYQANDVRGKGLCEVDSSGRVVAFVEKPTRPTDDGLVNAGIYVLDPAIHGQIPCGFSDFGHDVWPAVLDAGFEVRAERISGYLRDVGTPESLAQAQHDLEMGAIKW